MRYVLFDGPDPRWHTAETFAPATPGAATPAAAVADDPASPTGSAPVVSLADDQLLIAVRASGVNRADLLQRDADYLPPAGESAVPGLEIAGDVLAVGAAVTVARPGDRVCALLGSGGYADHALIRDDQVLPIPAGWSYAEAAALPEALATAWWNLRLVAGLGAGDRLLVHAANSGVGTTAVKLGRALGADVAGTVRTPALAAAVRDLGAFVVIDSGDPADLPAEGFDVVLDLVGNAVAPVTLAALRTGGRWISIGLLGGAGISLDLRAVIRRRLVLTGSSLRSLPAATKAEIIASLRAAAPWERADLRPVIAARYPAAEAGAALARLERGGLLGKIVLTFA